jgi:hypothetical protein
MANSVPASLTPRRLASETRAISEMAMATRYRSRPGAAETMATVPATTLTATVRT